MKEFYLSKSGGEWRVIFQGLPACRNTTFDLAMETAKKIEGQSKRNKLSDNIWDGDKGLFEPREGV